MEKDFRRFLRDRTHDRTSLVQSLRVKYSGILEDPRTEIKIVIARDYEPSVKPGEQNLRGCEEGGRGEKRGDEPVTLLVIPYCDQRIVIYTLVRYIYTIRRYIVYLIEEETNLHDIIRHGRVSRRKHMTFLSLFFILF